MDERAPRAGFRRIGVGRESPLYQFDRRIAVFADGGEGPGGADESGGFVGSGIANEAGAGQRCFLVLGLPPFPHVGLHRQLGGQAVGFDIAGIMLKRLIQQRARRLTSIDGVFVRLG